MAAILWIGDYEPGSYFPAVPIVRTLLARGHAVTAMSDLRAEAAVRALGCDFRPTPPFPAGPPTTDRAEKAARWQNYAQALFTAVADELQYGYGLVLADPLELGGGLAAEAAGVPWCSYVHFAIDETAADTPFRFHLWDQTSPADEAFRTWWNAVRQTLGLAPESRPAEDHVWWRHSADLTLVLGIPELVHPQGRLPPYARRVGPSVWTPRAEGAGPPELEALGTERPA